MTYGRENEECCGNTILEQPTPKRTLNSFSFFASSSSRFLVSSGVTSGLSDILPKNKIIIAMGGRGALREGSSSRNSKVLVQVEVPFLHRGLF